MGTVLQRHSLHSLQSQCRFSVSACASRNKCVHQLSGGPSDLAFSDGSPAPTQHLQAKQEPRWLELKTTLSTEKELQQRLTLLLPVTFGVDFPSMSLSLALFSEASTPGICGTSIGNIGSICLLWKSALNTHTRTSERRTSSGEMGTRPCSGTIRSTTTRRTSRLKYKAEPILELVHMLWGKSKKEKCDGLEWAGIPDQHFIPLRR